MSNRTLVAAVVGGVLVIGLSGASAWFGARMAAPPADAPAQTAPLENRLDEMERLEFHAQQDRRDMEQRLTGLESQLVDLADRLNELSRQPAAPGPVDEPEVVEPEPADEEPAEPDHGPRTAEELEEYVAQRSAEFEESRLKVKSIHLELMFGMYADTSAKGERNRRTQGRVTGQHLAVQLGIKNEKAQAVIDAVEEHYVELGPQIGPYVAEGRESVDGEQVLAKFEELEVDLDENILALLDEEQQELYRQAMESERRVRRLVLELWDKERLNR